MHCQLSSEGPRGQRSWGTGQSPELDGEGTWLGALLGVGASSRPMGQTLPLVFEARTGVCGDWLEKRPRPLALSGELQGGLAQASQCVKGW